MVEDFAAAIAKVVGMTGDGNTDEARRRIDRLAARFLELQPGELTRLSESELLKRTLRDTPPAFMTDKILMLVTALEKTGQVCRAEGNQEGLRAALLTALGLLFWLERFERNAPTAKFAPVLENVLIALAEEPLPVDLGLELMRYYESTGAFGKAEDILHVIRDTHPTLEFLPKLGADFYARLLKKPESQLIEGNLPRDEVEAGLKEWH